MSEATQKHRGWPGVIEAYRDRLPVTAATRADARALLGAFLADDAHYRASAEVYGDGGAAALDRALDKATRRESSSLTPPPSISGAAERDLNSIPPAAVHEL